MEIPEKYIDMLVNYGERLIFALLILIIGRIIIKLVMRGLKKHSEKKKFDPTARSFIMSVVSALLNILLILTIASTLGIKMTSFIAIIGAAGLAVGLALQGSLSNFAGGVLILIFRPFSVGDFIEAQGFMGTVHEIKILYTLINTLDNKRVVIPNGNLANGSVTNFSINPTRRVDFTFGISYDDSIDTARDIIKSIIDKDERIFKDPAPTVGVIAHADSSINFTVRVWCKREDYLNVLMGMHEAVKKEFDAAGITIPYPQQDVHLYAKEGESSISLIGDPNRIVHSDSGQEGLKSASEKNTSKQNSRKQKKSST